MKTIRVRREDLAPGACLCDHCVGKCCRYFSLPIATPITRRGFAEVRRYLSHEQTLVYVDKGTWYLLVSTRCKYLTAANRCGTYFTRPKVCQEYTTAECEYDTDWTFEKVFVTPEQLEEYAEAVLPPRRGATALPAAPRSARHSSPCLTIPITSPTTWDDFDALRWYLAHGQTMIYVEKQVWTLAVTTPPRQPAGPEPSKGTARRPKESEKPGPRRFDLVFETAEQLWEYAEAVLPPRRRRKTVGLSLPIISPG